MYLSIISTLYCFSLMAQAQEEPDWWFDVEILIFKHNNAENTVTEQFDTVVDKPFSPRISDVFLPFYVIDTSWLEQSLPECPHLIDSLADATNNTVATATSDLKQYTVQLDCVYPLSLSDLVKRNQPKDHYQAYATLPLNYEGIIFPRSEYAHMLPQSELQLTGLYKDLNWDKSYTPLLHTVWRQPVAIEADNAYSIPILAGKNLTFTPANMSLNEQSDVSHNDTKQPTKRNNSLLNGMQSEVYSEVYSEVQSELPHALIVQQIKASLDGSLVLYPDQLKQTQDKAMIDTTSVFEFEGLVTVYIKYINRVPYLHIDSHALFNTMQASDSEPLSIIPHTFQQRRRVISNQVHYFDHPYFGMVIELRRYRRPALSTPDLGTESSFN